MTTLLPTEKINVYMETEGGFVFQGQAYASTINMQSGLAQVMPLGMDPQTIPAMNYWDMELVGTGEPLWMRTKDDAIEELHSALEWRCPWCGGIMPRDLRQCTQCGGFRSFVYDLI